MKIEEIRIVHPFGFPVNHAGLPRDWCTIQATGKENLPNLSSQQIADIYWLLKSIRVEYAYTIDHIHRKRNFLLEALEPPKQRLIRDPRFYEFRIDESDYVQSLIELELYSIAHTEIQGLFHLNLLIDEHDEDHYFTLTTKDLKDQRLISTHNCAFLNREVTLKLWTVGHNWTGEIEYLKITPNYYTIKF